MNLPSPDEQLDLHGPRAKLPFEHSPPQARAGIKSSHGVSDDDAHSNAFESTAIITSGPWPGSSLSTTEGGEGPMMMKRMMKDVNDLSHSLPSSSSMVHQPLVFSVQQKVPPMVGTLHSNTNTIGVDADDVVVVGDGSDGIMTTMTNNSNNTTSSNEVTLEDESGPSTTCTLSDQRVKEVEKNNQKSSSNTISNNRMSKGKDNIIMNQDGHHHHHHHPVHSSSSSSSFNTTIAHSTTVSNNNNNCTNNKSTMSDNSQHQPLLYSSSSSSSSPLGPVFAVDGEQQPSRRNQDLRRPSDDSLSKKQQPPWGATTTLTNIPVAAGAGSGEEEEEVEEDMVDGHGDSDDDDEDAKRERGNEKVPRSSSSLRSRLSSSQAMTIFRRFLGFVGPGYVVSVGYMDPGNWATDLAGGSQFGYTLLFVILCSNLMAVVLQGLAVKLGVVTGLDLAQACRRFCPKYINWVLYVLAELAIIACDLAEVIGSAIALNLLFKIPLPWGVVITAADVLIILIAFKENQSIRARRVFEGFVMLLVTGVGICFTIEIVYSKPDAKEVMKGFLPSGTIFTDKEALYLAIGIIGATVMPHNLYLHSNIVKLRTGKELQELARYQNCQGSEVSSTVTLFDPLITTEEEIENGSARGGGGAGVLGGTSERAQSTRIGRSGGVLESSNLMTSQSTTMMTAAAKKQQKQQHAMDHATAAGITSSDSRIQKMVQAKGTKSIKHTTIRSTLRYTFVDSTIALTFALYVNSAILIVSAATFYQKHEGGVADLFEAFDFLSQALGSVAGYLFAVALLMAGQSSTLTATLAGQIVMEGFLGVSTVKPWIRRLVTRCLAIIPALVIVLIRGQEGLTELLLASQVALSLQLPFAVIPLVIFTSWSRCMTIAVGDGVDKPEEMSYGKEPEWGNSFGTVDGGVTTTGTVPNGGRDEEEQIMDSLSQLGHPVLMASPISTPNSLSPTQRGPSPVTIVESIDNNTNSHGGVNMATIGRGGAISAATAAMLSPVTGTRRGRTSANLLVHNFANPWWLVILAGLISLILVVLNAYLLVQQMVGN